MTMNFRHALFGIVAGVGLLSGCASSPYLDPPNWLSADNSPVWTSAARSEFVESIKPGETTLGEVVAMYGPAMAYATQANDGQRTSELLWYGETGLDQPWTAVVVPGDYAAWSESSPVLAVYTSEGLKKHRSTGAASETRGRQSAVASSAEPLAAPEQASGNPASSTGTEDARPPVIENALVDGVIGPGEVDDEIAAAMAAFGNSGGTVSSFRSRFGPEADYDEDTRLFRKVGSTLFYGSEYGGGPSIWVEFDGDDRYRSTMIHVPRDGNRAPYERFF
ncbi:hypothetical protein SADO_15079 [Salinisphaera dokdonensis CL-ES53]|uniref:Lipoprotein n=1 Tax=Salinisphaera dokdonensis CL-ES53 TaxID=1304272 RepID=A0ABV2B3X6_9GAMM